jgi:AcrR family transcriptional regulator
MEAAATSTPRPLGGEKAQRIVDAMRTSVARRGAAGSTFDHVAREAGVSRGLLHYYFGTKERLLVEVVRRDCEVRMEVLDQNLLGARTAEDFIRLLVASLDETVREDPEFFTVMFELFAVSRRNEELGAAFAELMRRVREHLSGLLAAKDAEGVLSLRTDPGAVADVLFSLADGVALRMLAEPERDFAPTIVAGVASVRTLLADAA